MVLIFFFLIEIAFANSISNLLNKIEKNEDLSLQTRHESAGISYIITRYQLNMMQAKYLKDVLKNTLIGYNISRYGLLDPWTSCNLPYSSQAIRIFINNQEITTGKYDNGLFLLGNIDLSFVDHIEIYYLNPTYKISTEPAYVIIKLYTKTPLKDEGKRISLSYGSYGSKSFIFDNAVNGKYLYYTHFSKNVINHKNIDIDGKTIYRNTENYHFLLTIDNPAENIKFLLNAIYQDQDPLMGASLDGRLDDGYAKYKEIHMGVEKNCDNLHLKYTVDYLQDDSFFYEESGLYYQKIDYSPYFLPVYKVNSEGYDLVNTLKINSQKTYKKNSVIYGVSLRNKKMNYTKLQLNDSINLDYKGIKTQNVVNMFVEDNYQIKANNIITIGGEMSRYFNNEVEDYTLKQYKITNTHLFNKYNIFKLSYQHIEYSVPPYFYKTLTEDVLLRPQKVDAYVAKYKKILNNEGDFFEIFSLYGINSNYPVLDTETGDIRSSDKDIHIKLLDLRYQKNYDYINNFILEYVLIHFNNTILQRSDKIILLNTHRYGKFDFFENVIYKKNIYNTFSKDGINVSLGAKYNVNENLTFSIKGENIFNSDYENGFMFATQIYPSVNYSVKNIQLTDRKITIGMEYLF